MALQDQGASYFMKHKRTDEAFIAAVNEENLSRLDELANCLAAKGQSITVEQMQCWEPRFLTAILHHHGISSLLEMRRIGGVMVALQDGIILKSPQNPIH